MEATGAVTAALPVPTQLKCVHTPSLAFRHLPLYTARIGYATEDALFIFCEILGSVYLVEATGAATAALPFLSNSNVYTLQASLSGTFPYTLPELVMPLKMHSLTPRSCPPMVSVPTERFGY